MEQKRTDQISDAAMWNRWRLVLGKYAEDQLSYGGDSRQLYQQIDDALDFLYGREYQEESGVRQEKQEGGREKSNPTVVTWLSQIRRLFPKQTVEVLERHALNRYGMSELVTDKEVLQKLEPNQELLKTLLGLKHMMKGDVLEAARKIVRQVVDLSLIHI